MSVGNEHNDTALGGDVTEVDHVHGSVDASHDDNSHHQQTEQHIDTHVDITCSDRQATPQRNWRGLFSDPRQLARLP